MRLFPRRMLVQQVRLKTRPPFAPGALMADREIVEVIYGEHAKYEIVRHEGSVLRGPTKYYIHKDGKSHRGSFSNLSAAVRAAEEEG